MQIFNYPLWLILFYTAIFFLLIAFIKRKRFNVKRENAAIFNRDLDHKTSVLKAANQVILDGGKGKEGEDIVANSVGYSLQEMQVYFRTNKGAGFDSAVLLPDGDGTLSSEIDMLVVTDFGVYAIEVKHWAGHWTASDNGKLKVTYADGSTEERTDPLGKTHGKLKRVMANAPAHTRYKALVVNSHPNGRFGLEMDSRYMRSVDLAQFFRQERDNNERIEGDKFEELKNLVFGALDPSSNAKHDHLMRLPAEGEIATYQANFAKINKLIQTPRALGPAPSPIRGWVFLGLCALAACLYVIANHPTAQQSRIMANYKGFKQFD